MTAHDLFTLVGWVSIVLVLAFGIAIPVLIVHVNRKRPERWL